MFSIYRFFAGRLNKAIALSPCSERPSIRAHPENGGVHTQHAISLGAALLVLGFHIPLMSGYFSMPAHLKPQKRAICCSRMFPAWSGASLFQPVHAVAYRGFYRRGHGSCSALEALRCSGQSAVHAGKNALLGDLPTLWDCSGTLWLLLNSFSITLMCMCVCVCLHVMCYVYVYVNTCMCVCLCISMQIYTRVCFFFLFLS